MGTKIYMKYLSTFSMLLLFVVNVFSQAHVPKITGPLNAKGLPATLNSGLTPGQVYKTEDGLTDYEWSVSGAGKIITGNGTSSITVDWVNPTSQQSVSLRYTIQNLKSSGTTVLNINYFPFADAIDPVIIPQFVDPLPHFAAGLRVDAKAGGNLLIKAVPVKQVALSTGTVLANGTIGDPATPKAGLGNYAAYAISKDNGVSFGPAMWPAQTIEAQQGKQLKVQYRNDLFGMRYADFNILADQTLMMNGYNLTGNPLTEPYTGDIPMVVHLHGGEMPSGSDGGPTAWFTPGYAKLGPGFKFNASSLSTYPNQQEPGTLWFHPHDQGLTGINVFTGLAGFYFLRGPSEEAAKLPGWSGDDLVQEVTPIPTGPADIVRTPTFNGTNKYLPEIEIAIQDRMFNVNGELYWIVDPPNPDIHPFWTPEFFGDIMTVNGKSWPYLSVAPRKYRFRLLDGCNARFLNIWLENLAAGTKGPSISIIGSDGAMMNSPATLNPNLGETLTMGPGERYDVIIDFTGVPSGTVFTLMNNANAPYPDGDPVTVGLTDRIMQFVVNGIMLTPGGTAGTDKSLLSPNLRPAHPMVKLTDFAGNLTAGVTPAVKRQLLLNEVSATGGPATVLINNAHFDQSSALPGAPWIFAGPSEKPVEGTTELYSIINTTVDAHPVHIHLLQWQLVSRQEFDVEAFMTAYENAWIPRGLPHFPSNLRYPGGAGPPFPYETLNADGAVGGNPAITPFLKGPVIPADPQERVWKDNIKSIPGQVATYVVRIAPTDRPVNAAPAQLLFPFDPSEGPGYVWHCHIVDHEDMDMMRPLPIVPSPLRLPQITSQPAPAKVCDGLTGNFSVTATSETPITYQWQLLSTGQGAIWTNLTNSTPYSGVTTTSLKIQPATILLTNNKYRVILKNASGVTTSNAVLLTVNPVPSPTITSVPGFNLCQLGTATYTTESGQSNYIWTIPGKGGTDYLKISGGTTSSNDLKVTWLTLGSKTVTVNYTNSNGCTAAVPASKTIDVANWIPGIPGNFTTSATNICMGSSAVYTVPAVAGIDYQWSYTGAGATISGSGNSVTVNYSNNATSGTLSVRASNGCSVSLARSLSISITAGNPPAMPAYFTEGLATVSQGQSNIRYTVPSVAGLKYNWSYSGLGATITGTSNSVLISFSCLATSGTLSVTASSGCGTSQARSGNIVVIAGNGAPAMPGYFTDGSASVTQGQSNIRYTVPFVAGMTYNWSYSGLGATITGTSNSVLISYSCFATSGKLSVTATNSCGTSAPQSANIVVKTGNNLPAMPAYFTAGLANVSQGQSNIRYTVPLVAGLTYNWSYSGLGATITGTTNSVLISFSNIATSGNLSVTASNSCGTSAARTGFITVNNLKAALLGRDTELQIIEAPSAKNEIKAYPNPTSGLINFDFRISDNARVTLDITSVNGQLIGRIFNADVEAGVTQTVVFDKSLAAGTYLYLLRWNDQLITGKFIKTK